MDNQSIDRPSVSQLRKEVEPAMVAFGLWLRLAIVGAGAVLMGVILSFDSPPNVLLPVALVLGGGLLAATSWRKATRILNAADDVTDGASKAPRAGTRTIAPRAT